jgi:DNA repair exonuclease SbcCD nuclease subunit
MKALLLGDVHISDRPPSLRKEGYSDDILAKLEFCVQKANDLHVDAIIQLGDMFHIKAPSRTSHRLVQRTHDVLSKSNAPVLLVVGNHDISNDALESVDSQPIGTLSKMSGMELLLGPHPMLDVWGVPYLNDPKNTTKWLTDSRTLVCSHVSLFPAGDTPPYDYISASDYAGLLPPGVSAVAYGHIHNPHGMYKEDGVWFCNNGAISRGSLHAETIHRNIKVTLYDSDLLPGNPFTVIDVPFKKPEDVFYTDLANHKANSPITDDFMLSMEGVTLAAVSHESILHSASALLTLKQQRTLEEILNEVQ